MLFSLALIFLLGFALSGIFNRLHIPGLLAMILTGIILGPYALNLIAPGILNNSADLREIALIIILARAGLSIDLKDLRLVGRPAILMCFVPATCEMLAITLLAPIFLHISYLEAAIMGAVLAAVSPAIIVPRMLQLMESGYGRDKRIPQLIMAGASVDDVYVIVVFAALLGMAQGEGFRASSLLAVPVSIILGLLVGVGAGLLLVWIFRKFHMRDTIKVLVILGVSFLLVTLDTVMTPYLPISGLLAVMALGGTILKRYEVLAKRLMGKFSKLWVGAEILLFVLVGAAVDIGSLAGAGLMAVLLILCALALRMGSVGFCLLKTNLTSKERLFCAIAYTPKATVQAAIGAIPLAAGLAAGNIILSVAVLAIMITAPLGAIGIDTTYRKLLSRNA